MDHHCEIDDKKIYADIVEHGQSAMLITGDKEVESFSLPDAEVVVFHQFFKREESDVFFHGLRTATRWGQGHINIYGKLHPEPRLTAWHGDEGKIYSYSGITLHPQPWTPLLAEIKDRVDEAAQTTFNSVLLNLYRDGRDSIGWHQDNEPELGINPVIASVSFGETRRFQMRHKFRKDLPKAEMDLEHGTLLLMRGPTQHFWRHQIPKSAKPAGPRINLTFRVIG